MAVSWSNALIGSHSKFSKEAISYVSVGDGSANNAHFLASLNLAKYCLHNGVKCPVAFVISDNEKCISLKGKQWIDRLVAEQQIAQSHQHQHQHHQSATTTAGNSSSSTGMLVQIADGSDVLDLYSKVVDIPTIKHHITFSLLFSSLHFTSLHFTSFLFSCSTASQNITRHLSPHQQTTPSVPIPVGI